MSMASFGAMFRREGTESVDLGASDFPPPSPDSKEILKTPTGGAGAFPTTARKNSSTGSNPFPTTSRRQLPFPQVKRPNGGPFGGGAEATNGEAGAGTRMSPLQEEEDRSQMNRLA